MLYFFNYLRRNRPTARDLAEEFRYFLDRVGATVSEEKNGFA
jgi:hypothetical protein